jgi:hypothetical protein
MRLVHAVVFLLSLAAASPLVSATNFGTDVLVDTTLRLAQSPFTITRAITVESGATLTLEAGVQVRAASGLPLVLPRSLSDWWCADLHRLPHLRERQSRGGWHFRRADRVHHSDAHTNQQLRAGDSVRIGHSAVCPVFWLFERAGRGVLWFRHVLGAGLCVPL